MVSSSVSFERGRSSVHVALLKTPAAFVGIPFLNHHLNRYQTGSLEIYIYTRLEKEYPVYLRLLTITIQEGIT